VVIQLNFKELKNFILSFESDEAQLL